MKKFTSLLTLSFLVTGLLGQSPQVPRNGDFHSCGHSVAEQEMLARNPEVAVLRKSVENQLLKRQAELYANRNNKSEDTYIIPVVFHVIHANGTEDISYEQIQSAIDAVNLDFAGQDPSINDVISPFDEIIAESNIEFRLATKDPDGNCTNGVVRYYDERTFSADDDIKVGRQWPTDMYMNVYTVSSISSGAGGYAYYPGASSAVDGIIALANYIGTTGTSSQGRSALLTHEIGHYLNLRHVWGNGNDPGEASNCNIDDAVSDTPNCKGTTSSSVSDCSLEINSCTDGEDDLPDNHQNFMDYTYCYLMFTEGQKARMRAALESSTGDRDNLWSASNLTATGTDIEEASDLCLVDFSPYSAINIVVGGTVDFSDLSYHGITTRNWTFSGGSPSSSTSKDVTVTYNTAGSYAVELEVSDGSVTDSKTIAAFVNVIDPETFFYEDFANGFAGNNILGSSWNSTGQGDDSNWEFRGPATSPTNSTGSQGACSASTPLNSTTKANGFMIFDADWWDNGGAGCGSGAGLAPGGNEAHLYTNTAMDFSDETFVALQFEGYLKVFSGSLSIYVGTNGKEGDYTLAGTIASSGDESSNPETFFIDLTSLAAGQNAVFIKFVWDSYYYFGAIDDVKILVDSEEADPDPASISWDGGASTDNWFDAANWSGDVVPTANDDVTLVNGDLVIVSGSAEDGYDALAANITLESGASLTVATGNTLNYSTIENDGQLNVFPQASLVPNDASSGNISGSGTNNIQYKLYTGQDKRWYNYFSSPIANGTITMLNPKYSVFFAHKGSGVFGNYYNDEMTVGEGYAARYVSRATFTGTPNNGDINVVVSYDSNPGKGTSGRNLIGNPYPSAISASDFVNDNSAILQTNAIYLYDQNQKAYGFYSPRNYIVVNAAGSSTPDADRAQSIASTSLASFQGFFVQVNRNGNIQFNNSMRNGENDNFKNEEHTLDGHKIWLELASEDEIRNALVVLNENNSIGVEKEYDASLLFEEGMQLGTLIKNKAYGIQALPPSEETTIIDLFIGAEYSGDLLTLSLTKEQGNHTNQNVYLYDANNDTYQLLTNNSIQLVADKQTEKDRYKLVVTPQEFATSSTTVQSNNFKVWSVDGKLNIQNNTEATQIEVYSVIGRHVGSYNLTQGFNSFSLPESGVMLVKANSTDNYTTKVVVR